MAHFAKLGVNGKVIAVHGLDNDQMLNADGAEDETVGQQRLQEIHGWPAAMWIQTSYNTIKNTHTSGDSSKAFRGNYAGIGFSWDEDNSIFWPKQPHASWTKNISTATWVAPITYPSVTTYTSGEDTLNWTITWNETGYQADNTKGWEGLKSGSDTVHDWNGSAWISR